jgi:Leucine-rich repeat (LRR) protein
VPSGLSALIMELLATDPDRRPPSAAAVVERLRSLDSGAANPAATTVAESDPRPKLRSSRRTGSVVAALVLVTLLAAGYQFGGTIVRFAADKGEVVIAVDDPDAQVTVRERGAIIHDNKGQRTITLASGEHELQVIIKDNAGETRFFTKTLVLTRGGKEFINVRRELASARPPTAGDSRPESPAAGRENTDAVRQAAEWALALGGRVRIQGVKGKQWVAARADLPTGAYQLVGLDLNGTPTNDAAMANVTPLQDLEELDLRSTQITDAGLVPVKGLLKLQSLRLSTMVSDAGLLHLTGLNGLRTLDAGNTRVSNAGLTHVKLLPALQALGLYGTSVTDEGLATIAALANLESLDLRATRVTEAGMASLGTLLELRSLELSGPRITDEGLRRLPSLPKLEYLGLSYTKVTDGGLASVQRLSSLRDIDVNGSQIGDAGLRHLRPLKQLRGINASGTRVTDDVIPSLKSFRSLEDLNLTDTTVSDAGAANLAELTGLTYLRLTGTRVTDAGVARLAALSNLKQLYLGRTSVTDVGLERLAGLKQLRELYLNGTKVTDAGLPRLLDLPLPPLTRLDISGTRISAGGAAAARSILPRAQIDWWEPNHRAADAVLAAGGRVHVRVGDRGSDVPVKEAAALPADYFRLTRVSFSGPGKPSSEVFTLLASLKDSDFDDLEELDLSGSAVSDADLQSVGALPCRRLVLNRTQISGPGLVHLKNLPRMTELSLECPALSFLGVRYVGELTRLKKLSLATSGATDASLNSLRNLTDLRDLDLKGTKVTAAGIATLKSALPQCQIRE